MYIFDKFKFVKHYKKLNILCRVLYIYDAVDWNKKCNDFYFLIRSHEVSCAIFFLWIRYAVITRKETLVTSLCNLETFSHEKKKGKKCSFVMIVFRKRLLWAVGCKYRFLPKIVSLNVMFTSDIFQVNYRYDPCSTNEFKFWEMST